MAELFEGNNTAEDKQFNDYFESRGEQAPEPAEQAQEAPEATEQAEAPASQDEPEIELVEDESAPEEGESEGEAEPAEEDETEKIRQREKNYKAALKSERVKRQELEKQYKQTAEEQRRLKESFDQMLAQIQTPQQQQQAPSYEEDPIGYLKHQQEQLNQAFGQSQQYLQQQQQMQQQQQQIQGLVNAYKTQAQEFAQEAPDFQDAYKFLEKSVINEYKALGHSDQEAAQLLMQDELYLAQKAQQDGINAGERVYELAKARGYSPEPQQKKVNNMSNVQRGMQRGKSLGTVAGSVDKNKIALSEIANLDDEDFDRLWSKYSKGQLSSR